MKKVIKASFFQKIVLPAVLAILLFVISVYAFIIPAFENNAIEQKRVMLHELTNTAWSILQKYHNDASKGLLSIDEAKQKAVSEVEALRYGLDKKDYFWITDLTPSMIMHPYVHELTGQSLHEYADPDGKKLFIEALKIAQESGEGFIRYKWQFKDDSAHIVPKLSFVKKFQPWDWIIGTGIYLDDVQREISSLTNKLILILLGISVIIALIIAFITYQSLAIENRRQLAEEQLHESREKYRSLLESSTEGIILLHNSKIAYTNAFIQNWLQYTDAELHEIVVESLFYPGHEPDFGNIKRETRLEIDLLRKDGSIAEAVLTMLPVEFAEKEGLLLTFRDTTEQRSVKTELAGLRNRLENISAYSGIGIFRFPLKGRGRLVEFNQNVAAMLGYNNGSELKNVPLVNILGGKEAFRKLLAEVKHNQLIKNKTIQLRKKDNSTTEVKISMFLSGKDEGEILFCDGIIVQEEINDLNEASDNFWQQINSIFSLNNHSVLDYCSETITCPGDAKLQEAIEIMSRNRSTSVLLMFNQKCIGIITQNDIIHRFLTQKMSPDSLATECMTAPVIFIDENTPLADASIMMEEKNISHLVVRNHAGEMLGVLDKNKLFGLYFDPSEALTKAIENSSGISGLIRFRDKIPFLVRPLLSESGSIQTICKMISKFNDSITRRIIETAISELGQPPVPFAFVTLGGAGREELAFNSDQDNAIIFAESETISNEKLQEYFLTLSARICKHLDTSGLPLCQGNYMASNPKWCQPLSVWKNYFSDWISKAEPENILDISVFFDLRNVYGNQDLFNNLEDHIFEQLHGKSAFFYFLAQSVAGFKPPVNVFGNLVTESTGKHSDAIDIKHSIASVIMFARTFALYNKVRSKSTVERVHALRAMDVFSQATADEVSFHYNFLMQLRLKLQISQIAKRKEITNFIVPRKMTEMEQVILKKVFSQMSSYQERLSASFMSAFKG
jgi:signal-transduction protein with cAMP-binding, CBS, and nucleotidyltransferase domain/PAS domain-containing protein